MPIRNKIGEFTRSRGLSTYRFLRDVKISQTTAYSIVNNPEHLPALSVVEAICDTYQVDINEILEWVGESESATEA